MQNLYATALWRTIESGIDSKQAVKSLHEALVRRGRMSLMPQIARAFARIAAREAEKNASILVVARKDDEKTARKESGAHGALLAIDESLIGGWRLENKEQLQDASWKTSLLSIYGKVTSQ